MLSKRSKGRFHWFLCGVIAVSVLLYLPCDVPAHQAIKDPEASYEMLQAGFQSRHWVVRAFTALRAGRFSDMESLRVLLDRVVNEENARVRAFALSSMAKHKRESLLMVLTIDHIHTLVGFIDPQRSPFASRHATDILSVVFERTIKESQRKWVKEIKSRGGRLMKERRKLLNSKRLKDEQVAWIPLPQVRQLKENETQQDLDKEQMRSVVPDGFGDYLRRLELFGVYTCVLLDDTSSMANVIGETRQRILDILGVMQEVTPKYHLAFITYKDRVNRTFDFSKDGKEILKFLKSVKAQGGGDDREGPDKALAKALQSPEIAWNPNAVKVIVIMGDQPPHRADEVGMLALAKRAAEKDITVNTIGTFRTTSGKPKDVAFFPEVAEAGQGEYTRLDHVTDLLENVLLLSFGPEYREFVKPFVRGMIEMRGIQFDDSKE